VLSFQLKRGTAITYKVASPTRIFQPGPVIVPPTMSTRMDMQPSAG
jgi:hypothetical protein